MKLSDFTKGRDNNFNLIRIAAAYAVLVTHSFALAIGGENAEPFREALDGMTMGSIAVDLFFVASGFLVTASLLTRQSIIEFVWARALRIFPALFVMLLLSVSALGLFFTTVPWFTYLVDPKLFKYFLKCLTLLGGVAYELPGVFEGNPYKNSVNGSLWTMPHELRMYVMLALLWISLRATRRLRSEAFKVTVVSGALLAAPLVILNHLGVIRDDSHFVHLFFMFFSGAAFFVLKDRIVLSYSVFCVALAALFLAMLYDRDIFYFVYVATIAYILFFVAYIPAGFIRKYNKLGDYSYGVYIYAFPVQQSIAALLPGVSVLSMVIISSAITFLLAVLSWHCLEKHALELKGHYVNRTQRLLAFGLTRGAGATL
jgi:peptidoglycan/LPS O-acetylase OafA/YrhL